MCRYVCAYKPLLDLLRFDRFTTGFFGSKSFLQARSGCKVNQNFFTGFSHELALPGSVGVCASVPTVTAYRVQHLCRVGLRHGGVQDVLPAQSHQTS